MTHRILVADGSATIREVVRHAFDGTDVEVLTVASSDIAIDLTLRSRPSAVILDAGLEGEEGYRLARELADRGETQSIPRILLCSAFQPFDETKADGVEFAAQLGKPFETAKLVETIESVLGTTLIEKSATDESVATLEIPAQHASPIEARPLAELDQSVESDEMADGAEDPLGFPAEPWESIRSIPLSPFEEMGRNGHSFRPPEPQPVELETSQLDSLRRQLLEELRRDLRDEVRAMFWELAPEMLADAAEEKQRRRPVEGPPHQDREPDPLGLRVRQERGTS